jgi:hypothetical protein
LEGKYSRQPHVVRFYGMLKNPVEYERGTSWAKFSRYFVTSILLLLY